MGLARTISPARVSVSQGGEASTATWVGFFFILIVVDLVLFFLLNLVKITWNVMASSRVRN